MIILTSTGIIHQKSGITGVQYVPQAALSYRTLECQDCIGKMMKGGELCCHIVHWNVELVTHWRMMMGGKMRESEKGKVKKIL